MSWEEKLGITRIFEDNIKMNLIEVALVLALLSLRDLLPRRT
jgi:hypothetical protein